MLVNATRVLPARFKGVRLDTGGQVEGLFVRSAPRVTHAGPSLVAPNASASSGPRWIVLLKMRRVGPGVIVALNGRENTNQHGEVRLRLIERTDESASSHHESDVVQGGWIVEVESDTISLTPDTTPGMLLEHVGLTPVPPYILTARKRQTMAVRDEDDRERYQTVYARGEGEAFDIASGNQGSVAAPTAGLHFTPSLLENLRQAGVARAEVLLDVGLGTFKPVETEFVEQHPMHSEWCAVPGAAAHAIARTRSSGGRVIAIGTTTCRTLESFASVDEMLERQTKDTRLLITPGYRFRHVDAMLTNFHLPRSTLLAMVGAMLEDRNRESGIRDGESLAGASAGVERLKQIYRVALDQGYRFYSYGDAMLILD